VLPGVEHVSSSYLNEGSGLRHLSDHFTSVFRRKGDYDRNGTINVSDYNAWRASFGTSQIAADGNTNGIVDAGDYVVWRRQLSAAANGTSIASAASTPAAVPEVANLSLLITAIVFPLFYHRRSRSGI
jgi:hypothetical protein